MLTAAGVPCTVAVAGVDEAAVRESLGAEGASTADAAIALGELKAIAVSRRYSDALVIGSDQMLDCNGVWFEKPVDRDHPRASLMALAARHHRLVTSTLVAPGGSRTWHPTITVRSRMRPLWAAYRPA